MSHDEIPHAIDPPFKWDGGEFAEIWNGPSELVFHDETQEGIAAVNIRILEHPTWRFEFVPKTAAPDLARIKRMITDPESVSSVKLKTEGIFGELEVKATEYHSGRVVGNDQVISFSANSLKFAVFNGPQILGKPVRRAARHWCGRLEAKLENAQIILDESEVIGTSHSSNCKLTHTASVKFESVVDAKEVRKISDTLFWTLSVMKLGWVGIVGPWHYDIDGNLKRIDCFATKLTRRSGHLGWCHEQMDSSFAVLFSCLYEAQQDHEKFDSIVTAMHYMIEAEQCSGGIEGAIILQQAALECLAWLEIVQKRSICSISGFKDLPAADKIRWLSSLYAIECCFPKKANFLDNTRRSFHTSRT